MNNPVAPQSRQQAPRRLGIWALLLGLVAALGLPGVTPAHAADSAVDVYGGCLVAQKAGDILIVIDESASLDQNDPDDARVASAKYLLTQLNSFAERTNVTLDVSVAGFSHNYAQAQDWTALDDAGLKETLDTVESFTDRPYGWETDYWMALEGARRSLAEHNPDGDRCQALVWITDGSLDLDARDTPQLVDQYGDTKPYLPDTKITTDAAEEEAEAEAERQICRDGGLADQLRSSGITVFGVGLRGEESPDYTLLESISRGGDAGGQHCGKITDPPGSFTEAADIDELLFEFDRFSTPNQERKDTEGGVCQGDVCPEERHTFVLDDSVQSVHILGSSDVVEAEAYLVTPQGEEIKLDRGTIGDTTSNESGGVTLDHSWQSERSIVIDMAAEAGSEAWSGPWSVVFVDPTGQSPEGKSRTSIAISGDVFPTWPEADSAQVRSGEMNQIQLGLVNADGDTIDPTTLLGTVSLDATLRTPDGQETPVAQGLDGAAIAAPLDLDLTNVPPGEATLVLSLSITTKDATDADGNTVAGTELEPQSTRIPVHVVPPPGYPSLNGQANFGSLEGRAEGVPGELTVNGPGCVWVEGNGNPNMLAGPENLGTIAITSTHNSAENCLEVPEGQSATLPLHLTTDGVDNGTLNADFTVKIAPVGEPDRVQDATASATANFAKPLNPVNFTLTLIVAALLGPGIPLGLLYLFKFLTAKIPGRALLAQEFPVEVEAGQVIRDGARFELKDRDLTSGMVQLAANGSRTAQAASATLDTKMGGSPFGEGHVRVETPGRIGASSSDTRPRGKESYARLPLNVHNHWVLLHDPNGPATSASVLLLVSGDAPAELREKLVDDINARVPDVLDAMRLQVGAVAGGDGGSPFGGPDGGPGGPQPGGPAPFDFGPDMGGQTGPNPFGGPPESAPFGGQAPASAPSGPAQTSAPAPAAPPVGAPGPASAPSAGMPAEPQGAQPADSNPFGQNPFGGSGANPYEQQAQQAAPSANPASPPFAEPQQSAVPQESAASQQSAAPQPSATDAPPQPAQQAPWGQQVPQYEAPQHEAPQHEVPQHGAAQHEAAQQAPQQQAPWGQQAPQQQAPQQQAPQQHAPWGQPAPPVEAPQQQWGHQQPPQQQPPQQQWGQPAQGEPPAQPPASEPSADEQFRPEAPPAGTQIRNPFEFGDNSGR